MSGDLPRHFNHLAHTEALAVAQVVDQWLESQWFESPRFGSQGRGILQRLFERMERQQVRVRQIADMDVIADAGAVGCRVVGAENVHVWGAAEGDFENPWDEMRLRLVGLALIGTGRAGGIEIAQAGIAQAVNLMEPSEHSLHQ